MLQVDSGEGQHIMYDLLGVVQHGGSLHGGHYTAFVKYPPDSDKRCGETLDQEGTENDFVKSADSGFGGSGDHYSALPRRSQHHYHSTELSGDVESGTASGDHWFYTSDSWIELATKEDVNRSQAYLLLYEKRHALI